MAFKAAQCFVKGDYILSTPFRPSEILRQICAHSTATVFVRALAAGLLDENAALPLGSGGEEMAGPVPVMCFVLVHQTHVGFMH